MIIRVVIDLPKLESQTPVLVVSALPLLFPFESCQQIFSDCPGGDGPGKYQWARKHSCSHGVSVLLGEEVKGGVETQSSEPVM